MKGFTTKQMCDLLVQNGWEYKHRKSSHISYGKEGIHYLITVKDCRGEMSRPMTLRLIKMAGIHI